MPSSSPNPTDLAPAQEERRRAIIEAAERLFAEGRFDEVLMEDVAARAGVAKGTVYRYFADKESLYLTVLTEGFEDLQRQLREVSSPDPVVRLEHAVGAVVGYMSRNRFLFRLMWRDESEAARRRGHRQRWKVQRAKLVDAVAEVLRYGEERGAFAVPHLQTDAQILLGMIRSCIRSNEQGLRPDEIVSEVVRVFLHGVRRPEARGNPATGEGP